MAAWLNTQSRVADGILSRQEAQEVVNAIILSGEINPDCEFDSLPGEWADKVTNATRFYLQPTGMDHDNPQWAVCCDDYAIAGDFWVGAFYDCTRADFVGRMFAHAFGVPFGE